MIEYFIDMAMPDPSMAWPRPGHSINQTNIKLGFPLKSKNLRSRAQLTIFVSHGELTFYFAIDDFYTSSNLTIFQYIVYIDGHLNFN